MEDHFKQSFSDAAPEPGMMAQTTAATAIAVASAVAKPGPPADSDGTNPGDLWPEAPDARCSESAALFSGTQPALLTVV